MAPHTKFAKLAKRLIAKHGRSMQIRKLSETPEVAGKGWRGPDPDAVVGFEYDLPVIGVVVDYEEEEIDGDQVRRGDKRILIDVLSNPTVDFTSANSILDETQVYSIVSCNTIKPGTTSILYDIQARQ